MLLSTIEELNKTIEKGNLAIIGTGWIAKLLVLYIMHIHNYSGELSIVDYKGENLLDWENIVQDDELNFDKNIIIAEKEAKGELISQEICCKYAKECDCFYLSELLKNEIDTKMMRLFPEEYEEEVLVSRKRELDFAMTKKIGKKICKIRESKKEFPIFEGIEIETINRCNGECSFCPVNKYDDKRPMVKMDDQLFYSIIRQLKELDYRGRVAMYSNNEPFLDERIFDFTEHARKELSEAFIYIFTNGSLLTLEKFKRIIRYLDLLCIDLYYDNIDKVFSDDMIKILEYCEDNNLCHKVMIQMIDRKAIRNNRGGKSKNRRVVYQPQAPCLLPFIQMIVRPDGKLSLCCNDPLGEYTMADLNNVSLLEAWNSQIYKQIRSDEGIGATRQKVKKCAMCDNYSTINQNGNMIFTTSQIELGWEHYRRIMESERE